jgi:hypothetical protein
VLRLSPKRQALLQGRSQKDGRLPDSTPPHCDVGEPCAGRHPEQKGAEKREKHERAHRFAD